MHKTRTYPRAVKTACRVALATPLLLLAVAIHSGAADSSQGKPATTTPIQYLVVIFQENVSFDHYFATYPVAANPPGEPAFVARPGTPTVNGLSGAMLTRNPNLANPFRLDRSEAVTCDMGHGYTAEQQAYHGGLMDRFVQSTGATRHGCSPKQVMGYYDGNTVTALWEYAQGFALNDNSFGTTFGPSTPGALSLVSGLGGPAAPTLRGIVSASGTVIGDADPTYDDCSSGTTIAVTRGQNVGDLLNAAGITWGWFQGGFAATSRTAKGTAVCGASHVNVAGTKVRDYCAHHEPFQYYTSTSNPHHLPPSAPAMIGRSDQANHQYDLSDFWTAVENGTLPAVSFLKAPKYQDGHPRYSDPLDEQTFLVTTINRLEDSRYWRHIAIVIAYDDSDGWYDHVMGPIVSQSGDPVNDALLGATDLCGTTPVGGVSDRCGYGPRLPLLVVSPYAKQNFVDHTLTDQTSILAFVEYNWHLGSTGANSFDRMAGTLLNMFDFGHGRAAPRLYLDPASGLPVTTGNSDSP